MGWWQIFMWRLIDSCSQIWHIGLAVVYSVFIIFDHIVKLAAVCALNGIRKICVCCKGILEHNIEQNDRQKWPGSVAVAFLIYIQWSPIFCLVVASAKKKSSTNSSLLGRKVVVNCKFNLKFVFHSNVTYVDFFLLVAWCVNLSLVRVQQPRFSHFTHRKKYNPHKLYVLRYILNGERFGLDSGDNRLIGNGENKFTSNRNESNWIESHSKW